MTLNPPTPGLKRVRNRTNSASRAEIIVQSGDELEVPGDVAEQLARQGNFSVVDPKTPKKKAAAKKAAPKSTSD